jgi:hypothetical protein
MVLEALNNEHKLVHANSVGRFEQSTAKAGRIFTCLGCKLHLKHVNQSICGKVAHFRHPATEEAKQCSYYSENEVMKTYCEYESETEFVKEWRQQFDFYPCLLNGICYSFGSSKARITVYGNVNCDVVKFRYRDGNRSPHLFLLDGTKRRHTLYRTEDTCDDWILFETKCEIGHILEQRGIAAIDVGHDYIAVICKTDVLPKYYRGAPGNLYPCLLWHVNEFIKEYMPPGYPLKERSPMDFTTLRPLHNTKLEMERQERAAKEWIEQKKREEALRREQAAKEWEKLQEKERSDLERREALEKLRQECNNQFEKSLTTYVEPADASYRQPPPKYLNNPICMCDGRKQFVKGQLKCTQCNRWTVPTIMGE